MGGRVGEQGRAVSKHNLTLKKTQVTSHTHGWKRAFSSVPQHAGPFQEGWGPGRDVVISATQLRAHSLFQ